MVFTDYQKQRILHYHLQGYRAPTIHHLLHKENVKASRVGIAKFIKKYQETRCLSRLPGSGRPSKVTAEIKAMVDQKMREDDETTACQLHAMLVDRGYRISLRTVLRCRTSLGWTFRGSSYCQLIREANKAQRLLWAQQHISDNFENVVWTDECTVQLETHRRFCCRKRGQPPRLKPRYMLPTYTHTCTYINVYVYMHIS